MIVFTSPPRKQGIPFETVGIPCLRGGLVGVK